MDGSAVVAESCAFLALRSGELWAVMSRVFARQPRGRIAIGATNDRKNRNPCRASRVCSGKAQSLNMANKRARSLKQTVTNGGGFRDRAIAEYHELLAADETLTPATFEKLRSAMRKNRLLYGDRPIGIALRPHLLDQKQFRALTLSAERVTSALEKVAAAVVQDPKLMDQLGLTGGERRMALVDPGFSTAGVTTRLDAFVHVDEIKFV